MAAKKGSSEATRWVEVGLQPTGTTVLALGVIPSLSTLPFFITRKLLNRIGLSLIERYWRKTSESRCQRLSLSGVGIQMIVDTPREKWSSGDWSAYGFKSVAASRPAASTWPRAN